MKSRRHSSFAVVALCYCLIGPSVTLAAEGVAIAPAASMNERVLKVPGDSQQPATLIVTVLTPSGDGPFPLVVMNHGSAPPSTPDHDPRYRYSFSSYYFLSRGYAVVLPMMRGYAGSEGRQVLTHCNQEAVCLANAKDIRAVIDYMSTQPFIDGDRTVVAGQSFGGWNTLAVGTLHHPQVKGMINFAGGANISDCRDNQTALARAAAHYGAKTTIPSLWLYGDNDSKFIPAVWKGMYENYRAAGGPAELVSYGRFMTDSHNLLGFPEGLRIWAPKVDTFLKKLGLPSTIMYPEYLPMEFPLPTNIAAIDDVNAVPYLTDAGRQTYRKFLAEPTPRVFVFSTTGLAASFNGGFDPLGRAMSACRQHSQKCQVYAVDDQVTWARPTAAPLPTHFAARDDVTAVPYVKAAGRVGYGKYLALRNPKAFVIAPDGAWSFSSLGDDPLTSAIQSCEKVHLDCAPYAVDDVVVWTSKTSH